MNKKIIIQLILFFIITFFISLFFFKYLVKTKIEKSDTNELDHSSISNKEFSNIIENIEYTSNDNIGNEYIIKAEYGEILDKDSNVILMKNVNAEINFHNNEKITISSSQAIYNTINYDTNFKENVFIKYAQHNVRSNNLDVLFKDHKIKLYNKIDYNNLNTNILADVMEIDLLTKDLKIYMNENNKKINATYNNNVNN
jgi:hypothetical protein|tara:strand:+ start:1585 stop:2181 length:597 start_codon:yes stop_codon:yes gene_type:complete